MTLFSSPMTLFRWMRYRLMGTSHTEKAVIAQDINREIERLNGAVGTLALEVEKVKVVKKNRAQVAEMLDDTLREMSGDHRP